MNWIWIDAGVIVAVHDMQIAEHGGGEALRDAGLLESALARPQNLAAYGTPDAAQLAAAYGYGIARNHPFVDGNKRLAFIAAKLFLRLNGWDFVAGDVEHVSIMLRLAEGSLSEEDFAAWIRAHLEPYALPTP
ncbi:type II toxin-antitoxin system death-on-curing family toxin [Ferrovibrio sp.]|uniref:type II toxin-antitoxin system death-on-curing family toxin n=1 Tax=Ferrovibrio sp. TaxID=1917215 RepID=UPI000CA90F2F|nr:type II toxin-antitoxin system death-on-curing family toxin [Ferrovibrio sp.]PJI41061.1 MAG: type II toxin-antitoxin system death-on-curing family toxin [Ferrovibrio sp.]